MSSILQKTEIKIEALCRTCLSKEIELLSVFDACPGDEEVTLDSVIATITGVKIVAGDGLPATVCRECSEQAHSAFSFRGRARRADDALRGLVRVKMEEAEPAVDVKIEEFSGDIHDDYLDMDFTMTLPNGDEHPPDFAADAVGECDEGTYCPVCGASFEDAAGLTRHVWQRHADLMGPKKRGRPKQLLTSTILSRMSGRAGAGAAAGAAGAAGAAPQACALCRLAVDSHDDLATHMMLHKDEKVLSCLCCKKMYLQREDFDRHSCAPAGHEEHQVDHGAACAVEIALQELLARGDSVEVCDGCGGVFGGAGELARHRDAEHPERSLRCGHCLKVFASLRGAARHRRSCALVERAHACAACGLRFQHAITLNKHILRSHAGLPVAVRFPAPAPAPAPASAPAPAPAGTRAARAGVALVCDTCGRTFRRKELLLRHAKLHQPDAKSFECDVCKKRFNRRNNLRSHMRTHEAGARAAGAAGAAAAGGAASSCLCLYCGRGFSNSSNLIVHMRRHTGEKPYKCDFCGKGFPRSSDLQCHRRSHTGEKPCVCGVCGKGFSRSNKLSRHMRVHTGLKPYKCPYCEKAFSQSNDLTLHVRRHTGDKPYVCELCGDRFIQGTALHNHRRAHGHFPPAGGAPAPPYAARALPD